MPTNHFDEPVAATYDDNSASMFAPEVLDPTLEVLVDLAGPGGSALELAVGTGRVALPLAAAAYASTGSSSPPPCCGGCTPSRAPSR